MPSYEVTVIETIVHRLTVEGSDKDTAGDTAETMVEENDRRDEWFSCKECRAEFIDEVDSSEN
jgi:hypothetical protein